MRKRSGFILERGSKVWVWDSTWLPAVVVRPGADSVLVRLEHGVTFQVAVDKLDIGDPARGGTPRFPLRPGGGANQR
jgi:hypothetical protein